MELPAPVRLHVLFDRSSIETVSRSTVAFRLILAVPHLVVLYLLSIVLGILGLVAWFAALFTARVPASIHEVMTGMVRYQTRAWAYLLLLTDEYPPFGFHERGYPVQVEVGSQRLNRLAVLFRLFLGIPALVVFYALVFGVGVISVVIWLVALVVGRVPQPLFDAAAAAVQYGARATAYFQLLTPAYPTGLFGEPTQRWDDEAFTAAVASYGGPEPPRFSRGSRVVTGLILGVGVLAAVGAVLASSIDAGTTDTELRKAHDRLITQVNDSCAGRDSCPQAVTPQQQAAFNGRAFATFGEELDHITIPANAEAARERLAAQTNRLAQVFSQLGNANTATAFNRLYDTSKIDALLSQWDTLYDALETAIG